MIERCGRKRVFTSREQAELGASYWGSVYGKKLRIYKCDNCCNFHHTSKEKWRWPVKNEDGLREFWLVTTDEDTLIMSGPGFAEMYKQNHGCNEIIHVREVKEVPIQLGDPKDG